MLAAEVMYFIAAVFLTLAVEKPRLMVAIFFGVGEPELEGVVEAVVLFRKRSNAWYSLVPLPEAGVMMLRLRYGSLDSAPDSTLPVSSGDDWGVVGGVSKFWGSLVACCDE